MPDPDRSPRSPPIERKLRRSPHLDRQAATNLHLLLVSAAHPGPGEPTPPSNAQRPSRNFSSDAHGVTTLPFDSISSCGPNPGSSPTGPRFNGSAPNSRSARTTVRIHVMNDVPTLRGADPSGTCELNRSSSSQPHAAAGTGEDVAHVPMMSSSPTKPPATPRLTLRSSSGTSDGSTGRAAQTGVMIRS